MKKIYIQPKLEVIATNVSPILAIDSAVITGPNGETLPSAGGGGSNTPGIGGDDPGTPNAKGWKAVGGWDTWEEE